MKITNTTMKTSTPKRLAVRTDVRAGLTYSGEPGHLSGGRTLNLGDTATHEVGHFTSRR